MPDVQVYFFFYRIFLHLLPVLVMALVMGTTMAMAMAMGIEGREQAKTIAITMVMETDITIIMETTMARAIMGGSYPCIWNPVVLFSQRWQKIIHFHFSSRRQSKKWKWSQSACSQVQEDGKNYHSTALKFPDSFAKPSKWRSLFGNIDWHAFSRTSSNKKVKTYFHLAHIYGLILILLYFYHAHHLL